MKNGKIYYPYYDEYRYCYNYDILKNKLENIFIPKEECENFETYTFINNYESIYICNKNGGEIYSYKLNITDLAKIDSNYISITECKNIYNFAFFYNNYNNEYNLITDCVTRNQNWNIINTNSLLSPPPIIPIPSTNPYIIQTTFITSIQSTEPISISISKSNILSSIDTIKIKENRIEKYFNGNKKELIQNLTEIIKMIEIGENYQIIGKDFNLVIKLTNSSFLNNLTHVDFKKCEEIIRNTSNISNSRILTFLQLEIENINEASLVNQLEYQVLDDNKTILNLSVCNDTDIEIFFLLNDDTYDFSSYNYFKNSDVNIFNINDSFFNDICHPYSNSKNDIILEDRIKDIYQNYSLCDQGCKFKEINFDNKTISCDCKVKMNLSIEEPSLDIVHFEEIEVESNFGLIKCYNLVFSFINKFKNIGFWIFLILVTGHIPLLFLYFYKGIKNIKDFIINEMIKYGYIKDGVKNKNKKKCNKSRKKKKSHTNVHSPIKKNRNIGEN